MLDFGFYLPTEIIFGKGSIKQLGEQVRKYGNKILLLTGKGSVRKNGIYDSVTHELAENGIEYMELSGVDPNPRISTVRKGAAIIRENRLTFILAVGGGSTIDCAKAIAAAACYDGDPWDIWSYKANITDALPIGTVLTLAATGSEMNDGAVITNEETKDKNGFSHRSMFPRFSILDPAYTFTVPKEHTAAGVADIMAHVFEFYFSQVTTAYLQDRLSEGILKTCIKYGPIAYHEPDNYEARANLMWAGSMALNGITCNGTVFDGFNHLTEHVISGIYDITHGVGLAILIPHWMEYILDEATVDKLSLYAKNVWDVTAEDKLSAAKEGINKTTEFFKGLGLPLTFSEAGISLDRIEEISQRAVYGETLGEFKKLTRQDVANILEASR
jgi:alcohol dehydrogenase YqhD (iron-dependent ADH family)